MLVHSAKIFRPISDFRFIPTRPDKGYTLLPCVYVFWGYTFTNTSCFRWANFQLWLAGGRNLSTCVQNLSHRRVQQFRASMDLEKESPMLNRDLYPSIEPYGSGFLKVSDLHTLYWEQSGNPNGHVSRHPATNASFLVTSMSLHKVSMLCCCCCCRLLLLLHIFFCC